MPDGTSLRKRGAEWLGASNAVELVAGPSFEQISNILDQQRVDDETTDEELEAFEGLLEALDRHPYFTRLYTRLSAEEMTSDPVLGRSSLGDVPRQRDHTATGIKTAARRRCGVRQWRIEAMEAQCDLLRHLE